MGGKIVIPSHGLRLLPCKAQYTPNRDELYTTLDPVVSQQSPVHMAGLLAAAGAVVHQARGRTPAAKRQVQGLRNQGHSAMMTQRPALHVARRHVHQHRHIHPPCLGPQGGAVAPPPAA